MSYVLMDKARKKFVLLFKMAVVQPAIYDVCSSKKGV